MVRERFLVPVLEVTGLEKQADVSVLLYFHGVTFTRERGGWMIFH